MLYYGSKAYYFRNTILLGPFVSYVEMKCCEYGPWSCIPKNYERAKLLPVTSKSNICGAYPNGTRGLLDKCGSDLQ
jgi:hypothetical protein